MAAKAVPEGFHTLTAHLVVKNAAKAIEFYKRAFGAEVLDVHHTPDGRVMHASLKIGDSRLMLNDEFPEWGTFGPQPGSASPVTINMYSEDVDAVFNRAVGAGAKVTMPLADQFWGDRYGKLQDPFGHQWALAKHVQDVSPEELVRRGGQEVAKQMAAAQRPGGSRK